MDFLEDYRQIMLARCARLGFRHEPETNLRNLLTTYLNWAVRRVPAVPRRVLKSDTFVCPKELIHGLELLIESIEIGKDLTPYLSARVSKKAHRDDMLKDWGIYHLHLGTEIQDDGFIKRTEPVVFALFDFRCAYLICVENHGKKYRPWTKLEMLNTIDRNWPVLLEGYALPGVVGLEPIPSEDDIAMCRKFGVQTLVQLASGKVLGPLGGGMATDGSSIKVTMRSIQVVKILEHLQVWFCHNLDLLRTQAESQGVHLPEVPEFRLAEENAEICAIERSTSFKLTFPTEIRSL